ncbi:hypothetical protein [Actinomadura formosensis]|uniref:hypothetical protein n=1 Tax=Actinomadura formosensis TaxID=60706 RepID=UPI00082F369A|nr:hypothetical protein [Actinomadura formosensis]
MSEKVVRQCKRTWRRIGVSREDGAEMAGELAADLRVALADGRDPQSYVGGDPAGFARAWASERGVVPLRYRTGRLMAASLLGALPGLFAGLFMVFGTSSDELEQVLGRTVDVPTWLVMILYTASAVFVWAGVLAAVSAVLRFHADAARRATVGALAVLLPFFAVAAVVGTAMVARLYGYPYGLAVVAEVTVPLSIMTGLVGVTRVVIVRRFRPSAEPAGSLWDAVPA